MSQSCLRPTKAAVIFTLGISEHARHTELEDCQRNMLSYLFSQSYGIFLPFHYLSSTPHFFPFFFHLICST